MSERPTQSRAQRLRTLIEQPQRCILMGAHDGLSAKLAQEAGFEALWASGLSMAAALGVRDCNEASWTQMLDLAEFMADACSLPILLDGDTGYGNFNNVRRLVRKLEQRGVSGVCIEDKRFPKDNSLWEGGRQSLADLDEFCGRLRAAKDTQRDAAFVLVARTEAFICGCGSDVALQRAHAYAECGADAILVHSRRDDESDLRAFMAGWERETPVIAVPTTYPSVPLDVLQALGVHNFIFANQGLRAMIRSLQHNLRTLRAREDLTAIEDHIAPMSEVFRLQDMDELRQAEARYAGAHRTPRPPKRK